MRRSSTIALGAPAAMAAIVLLIAGCGSSNSGGGSGGSGEGGGGGGGAYAKTRTTTETAKKTPAGASGQAVLTVKQNPVLEAQVLAAGPKKLTVYMFVPDRGKTSVCYGACAAAWPPVTTTGNPKAEAGVNAGMVGTSTRKDGTKQVTYAGHPLYFYAADSSEAAISGQGINSFGGLWWVLAPGGQVITKS